MDPIRERDVVEALSRVVDPQLHQSIITLNLVRRIDIDGRTVDLLVSLPAPGEFHQAQLETEIAAALLPLGVEEVNVDFTQMTDAERSALRAQLTGSGRGSGPQGPGAGPHAGPPGGPIPKSPLTDPATKTRIFAIASGKGGVGKSSLTANLAVALAQAGVDVAVIDADVYGFSIPKMLGVIDQPEVEGDKIVPPVAHGVKVVSMGFFIEEEDAVVWRGPMLHKALQQFITDVDWGDPGVVLIDMPPGTGDVSLSVSQFLPRAEMVIVTTPQPAAQRVAQRAAAMARKVDLGVAGVVENMSWFTGEDGKRYELFGSGGGKALADALGVPLLAQVPLVPEVRIGADEGVPVVVSNPESEASAAIRALAADLRELKPRKIRLPSLSVSPSTGGGPPGATRGGPPRSGAALGLSVTPVKKKRETKG